MLAKILSWFHSILKAFKDPWVRQAGQILMILACIWYVYKNWENLMVSARDLKISADIALISVGLYTIALLMGIFSWFFILESLDNPISIRQSAISHLRPVMSKYIPGYAWQYLGKGYISNEAGASAKNITLGFTLEIVLILWTGTSLGIALIPTSSLLDAFPGLSPNWFVFGGVGLLILLIASILASNWIILRIGIQAKSPIKRRSLFIAACVIFAAWFFHGAAFWVTSGFFGIIQENNYLLYTATYTLAFLLGWIIFFVPNGLGIREGIMILLLSKIAPAPSILSVAIVFRFIQFSGDIVGYLISMVFFRPAKGNNP